MNTREPNATKKLIAAAEKGDISAMNAAFADTASGHTIPQGYHAAALYYAAFAGQTEAVRLLLEKSVQVDAAYTGKDESLGQTAVFVAAAKGHTQVVKLLCDKGADVNVCNNHAAAPFGATPLIAATIGGHTECMQTLLLNGANVKFFDRKNHTALYYAAERSKEEKYLPGLTVIIDHLISTHQNDPQSLLKFFRTYELHNAFSVISNVAAGLQLFRLVNFLLEKRIDRETVLKLIPEKYRFIYEKLTAKRSKEQETTNLNTAAGSGDNATVNAELEAGANINAIVSPNIQPPLSNAVWYACTSTVELLLARGADTEVGSLGDKGYSNSTALDIAAQQHKIAEAKILLKYKANTRGKRKDGFTPLMRAAQSNDLDMLKLLLQNGADATLFSSDNLTALNYACSNGHSAIVRILVNDLLEKHKDNPQKLIAFLNANDSLEQCLKRAIDSESFSPLLKLLDFMVEHKQSEYVLPRADEMKNKNHLQDVVNHMKTLPSHNRIRLCNAIVSERKLTTDPYYVDQFKKIVSDTENELRSIKMKDHLHAQKQLYWAAAAGFDFDLVAECKLKIGTVDSKPASNWEHPLFIAAANGHAAMVEYLINQGANMNQRFNYGIVNDGKSAVHIAAENGHADVLRVFAKHTTEHPLSMRAYIRNTGTTPLLCAIYKGKVEAAKVLIENGGITSPSNIDHNELYQAINYKQPEIVNAMVDKMIQSWTKDGIYSYLSKTDPNNRMKNTLGECFYRAARTCEASYLALIRLCDHLIAQGFAHSKIIKLLSNTVYSSNKSLYIDFKQVLIDEGNKLSAVECARYDSELLNPDTYKGFIMHIQRGPKPPYINRGKLNKVFLRKEKNTRLNDKLKTDITTFEKLAKEYDDKHSKGKEEAHQPEAQPEAAVTEPKPEPAKVEAIPAAAVAETPAMEEEKVEPATPELQLYQAASKGAIDEMKQLLAEGVKANCETNIDLRHPIIIASYEGRTEAVKLLHQAGADINTKITQGEEQQIGATALFAAAEAGHIAVVEYLLGQNADLEAANSFGVTPLLRAAATGRSEIVSLLLTRGANILAKTNKGSTVLKDAGKDTAKILIDHLIAHHTADKIFALVKNTFSKCLTKASDDATRQELMRLVSFFSANNISEADIKSILPEGYELPHTATAAATVEPQPDAPAVEQKPAPDKLYQTLPKKVSPEMQEFGNHYAEFRTQAEAKAAAEAEKLAAAFREVFDTSTAGIVGSLELAQIDFTAQPEAPKVEEAAVEASTVVMSSTAVIQRELISFGDEEPVKATYTNPFDNVTEEELAAASAKCSNPFIDPFETFVAPAPAPAPAPVKQQFNLFAVPKDMTDEKMQQMLEEAFDDETPTAAAEKKPAAAKKAAANKQKTAVPGF